MYKLFVQTECPHCEQELMLDVIRINNTNGDIDAYCDDCDEEFTVDAELDTTPTDDTKSPVCCPTCSTDMKYIKRVGIWDQSPEYKCSQCNSTWDILMGEIITCEIPF